MMLSTIILIIAVILIVIVNIRYLINKRYDDEDYDYSLEYLEDNHDS